MGSPLSNSLEHLEVLFGVPLVVSPTSFSAMAASILTLPPSPLVASPSAAHPCVPCLREGTQHSAGLDGMDISGMVEDKLNQRLRRELRRAA